MTSTNTPEQPYQKGPNWKMGDWARPENMTTIDFPPRHSMYEFLPLGQREGVFLSRQRGRS